MIIVIINYGMLFQCLQLQMFFQLEEVIKIERITNELQKAKDRLNSSVIDAYTSDPKIKQSLSYTITEISKYAEKKLEICRNIEEDSLNGFFIPSFIDFQGLASDKRQLPQWTRVVFEKQFEKQKKSLDIMAKKIYMAHSLTQAKDKLERQMNAFKVLSGRYKALSEYDETIDIMNQAEKLKNLTKNVADKYFSYCNVIAGRVIAFVDQMISKCSHFSSEIQQFVGKTTKAWVHPQGFQKPSSPRIQYKKFNYENEGTTMGSGQNWLTRANRTLDKQFYRSANHHQHTFLRQPKWLNTLTSDYYN